MGSIKCLIVDDEELARSLLKTYIAKVNFLELVADFENPLDAIKVLKEKKIDLLLLDIQMPEIDGLQLLKFANEHYPEIPKLVVTGYPSVEGTLEVIKSGATDYLTKPFTKSELKEAIDKALSQNTTRKKSKSNTIRSTSNIYSDMVGESTAFRKVTNVIDRVKDNKATVIVTGESGTGKELVARAIHYSGKFSREPFIAVNCAAIPENLQEAELFGYMKGAFTGANENRNGFFQAAKGGTLFLDEIGNLSLQMQAKLLSVIQNRVVVRVGSNKPIAVDIRLICATNCNLDQMVAEGLFREDLLYRINTIQVQVPALRERDNDVLVLSDFFLKKFANKYGKPSLKINQTAQEKLMSYAWPGNVRELLHTMERAVILSEGNVLKPTDFLLESKTTMTMENGPKTLEEMELVMITKALNDNDGNYSAAADQLGISRQTLYNKLKKSGK